MPVKKLFVGNVFETPLKHIAHGCNAQGVMGSGVAKTIKEEYPEAFLRYKRHCQNNEGFPNYLLLGDVVSENSNNKVIHNMITQLYYGKQDMRYVSYDAITKAFEKLDSFGIDKVAIPKIGAGLGGGNWKIIETIIDQSTRKTDIWVYDYGG